MSLSAGVAAQGGVVRFNPIIVSLFLILCRCQTEKTARGINTWKVDVSPSRPPGHITQPPSAFFQSIFDLKLLNTKFNLNPLKFLIPQSMYNALGRLLMRISALPMGLLACNMNG